MRTCEYAGQAKAADGVDGLFRELEEPAPASQVPQEPVTQPGHNVSAANYCHEVGSFHHTQTLQQETHILYILYMYPMSLWAPSVSEQLMKWDFKMGKCQQSIEAKYTQIIMDDILYK